MPSSARLPRLAATVLLGAAAAMAAAACGSLAGAPAPGGVTSKSTIRNATDASAARGSGGGGASANPTGWPLLPPAPVRTVPDFLVAAFKIAAG